MFFAITIAYILYPVRSFLVERGFGQRLARLTAGIPGSLYFVGFVGGPRSAGMIGSIAGPVAVALVAEAVQLLVYDSASAAEQQEFGQESDQPAMAPPDDQPPSIQ